MRSIKYLNVILTVLCGLMVLQLWTTWTNPGAPAVSLATPVQAAPGVVGGGIPDPGAQQKEIIDLLKELVRKTEEQTELFRSGQARVRLEAPAAEKPKG
jgi:hypothetical protein